MGNRMNVTRSLLVAALLIAVSSAPALSNACDSASWEKKSENLPSLVEKINGAGFAHLADLRREETGDVAVSPFAIWYLDEFLGRSWQTASNDASIALRSPASLFLLKSHKASVWNFEVC